MKILLMSLFAGFLVNLLPAGQSKTVAPAQCTFSKNDGEGCEMQGKSGVCFSGECFIVSPSKRKLVVKVRYPLENAHFLASKSRSDSTPTMWLRGNGLGLTWSEGKQMKVSVAEKDTWEVSLEFTVDATGSSSSLETNGRFEFRVYLDDEMNMLGPNFVLPLPPSSDRNEVSDWVGYPWFYSKTGTTKKRRIYSPDLKQNRSITVHTPASFSENKYKKYETLFVNDGQRLKHLTSQVDHLSASKALLNEVLLIGVDNDFNERTRLMAPSNGTDVECRHGNQSNLCNNCLYCTSDNNCSYQQLVNDYTCYKWVPIPDVQGQRYLDFIQNTLIAESKTSYRALAGSASVGIMGFSFGGLAACHAMWTRPQTFGSAACLSPSLWWPFPENGTFPYDAQFEFVTSTLGKHRGVRPRQKVYIDVGSEEGYIMLSPALNATRILANSSYFEMNKNLWFYVWNKQKHSYKRVLERVWAPLIALYGAQGSPRGMPNSSQTQHHPAHTFFVLVVFLAILKII